MPSKRPPNCACALMACRCRICLCGRMDAVDVTVASLQQVPLPATYHHRLVAPGCNPQRVRGGHAVRMLHGTTVCTRHLSALLCGLQCRGMTEQAASLPGGGLPGFVAVDGLLTVSRIMCCCCAASCRIPVPAAPCREVALASRATRSCGMIGAAPSHLGALAAQTPNLPWAPHPVLLFLHYGAVPRNTCLQHHTRSDE